MYIRKVVSFEGAWAGLDKNIDQVNDINRFVGQVTLESIRNTPDRFSNEINGEVSRVKLFHCWDSIMENSGWVSSRRYLSDDLDKRKYYGHLGHCLKDISIKFIMHRDLLNRWLFSTAPIAYKNSVINMPVAVMLTAGAEEVIHKDKRINIMSANFEKTVEELQALSPLSQSHPFLIIGISFDDGDLEVVEIESELGISEKQVVINRSIEFPPEFHSAGIGILSYFGTVLREKYPDQEAKVKIEQDGNIVRMVIETKDGDKEIIEKALQEYELVVTGEKPPEAFYDNALKVIELKTELRVAYTKIESQRDLLIHKGQELSTLKSLFENSLSRPNEQLLSLNVSPVINVTATQNNSTVINNDILDVADEIKSLISKSGDDSGTELRLLDLNSSMDNIDATSPPEEVKNSVGGLTKLKRLIDDALNTGSDLHDFFEKISGGADKLKGLACKYNSIAEWCGAPQIPSVFLK